MGKKRKLISYENQIKGNANAIRGEAKERKKEDWSKKDQKGGNDDVLGTKLCSGSISIETKNKGGEIMMPIETNQAQGTISKTNINIYVHKQRGKIVLFGK